MRTSIICTLLTALCVAACVDGNGREPSAGIHDDAGATSIAAVQGHGGASPMQGQSITVEGIVSGDFQDNDADTGRNLGGFFLQSDQADADPNTSDGIFVFDGDQPAVDVNEGDRITVSGRVKEHFGETQIAAAAVVVSGTGTIRPTDVLLPAAAVLPNSDGLFVADLERYEGMLVRFPQTLTISELFDLERFGAIRLSEGGRLYQFTNLSSPDAQAYIAHRKNNAARSLTLDDGQRSSNANPIRYLSSSADSHSTLRVGDTLSGLTGNLRYSRGSGRSGVQTWRLMPAAAPVFVNENPRPGAPALEGALKIASFNVLNYFSTVDSGRQDCGPSGDSACRGADSEQERQRQLAKTITALELLDADIIGLIELENNESASLSSIVDALNASVGAGSYRFLDTGVVGNDAIKVGYLYKPSTVALHSQFAVLDGSVDPRFRDARNRPVLAQTFAANLNQGRVTVVLAHLKSKGSDCESDGDPNVGDGQGNCNRVRTDAATAVVDWLATDPTSSGDTDFLVIGDLNAYLQEDLIVAFEKAGFVNLVKSAFAADAYSFVFDGQTGALDHALASPSLVPQVAEVVEWHINADEAPVHDYNLENGRDPGIFEGTAPYRASDHDPVVVGLDLN